MHFSAEGFFNAEADDVTLHSVFLKGSPIRWRS
jgi:hypothetical protein